MRRLIDANALMDKLLGQYCKDCERRKGLKRGKQTVLYGIGDVPCRSCVVDDMTDELAEAPTIDPVRHGRWEIYDTYKQTIDGRTFDGWCECSECRTMYPWDFSAYDYCPHCGAKMDGGEDGTVAE